MEFKLNSEIVIGVTLVAFGVFSFAKGTSKHFAKNHYKEALNLVNTSSGENTDSEKISNVVEENDPDSE